jgi:hypothetical protein
LFTNTGTAALQSGQSESSAGEQQRFYHPIQSLFKDQDYLIPYQARRFGSRPVLSRNICLSFSFCDFIYLKKGTMPDGSAAVRCATGTYII